MWILFEKAIYLMASKVTTGLVGLKVLKQPRRDLLLIYYNILKVLKDIPATASYRKFTEQHVNERIKVLKSEQDITKVESIFNSGQIEEVAEQAKREYKLARNMRQWKPWEGKVTQPPAGQWTWP